MKKLYFIITFFLISCGSSQKAWHMGADSNDNGVRDDIEKWIMNSNQYSEREKKGIMNFAKIDPASCDYHHHLKCLENVTDRAFEIQLSLLSKFNDTEKRQKAYQSRVKKCFANESSFLNFKCDSH